MPTPSRVPTGRDRSRLLQLLSDIDHTISDLRTGEPTLSLSDARNDYCLVMGPTLVCDLQSRTSWSRAC